MGKRRRVILIVSVVAVFCGLVWFILREPPEPVYQGKSLRTWLEVYRFTPPEGYSVDLGKVDEMTAAVRHIGTNGIPILLRMLKANDYSLKTNLVELLKKQKLVEIKTSPPAFHVNFLAARGFEALGPIASNAVPALLAIYERNISEASRCMTIESLAAIGPAAEPAIPCMLEARTNANESIRFEAVQALGKMQSKPNLVVPALAKSLKDQDGDIRLVAVLSLGMFGPNGRAAIPELVQSLTDQDADVAVAAADVLKKIDPEAAAKAGIK